MNNDPFRFCDEPRCGNCLFYDEACVECEHPWNYFDDLIDDGFVCNLFKPKDED